MWTKTEKIYKPETIRTQMGFDLYEKNSSIDHEGLIKSRLIQQLFEGLSKYVRFDSLITTHDPYKKLVQAEITIVPSDISDVIHNDLVYKVKDIEFTHDQIEEAVLNHFPEYFL